MRTLLLKELRALVPVYVVTFLLISGDIFTRPFSQRLDEASWSSISSITNSDQSFYAFMLVILALIVAYAALPREHDEGTIELLYSLPISRTAVFGAKAIAGMTVLVMGVAGGAVTDALLAAPNPQSLGGEQFHLGIAATSVFLRGLFAIVIYCHALFASFFRRLGLIPFMGIAYGLVVFQDAVPDLAFLDPSTMADLSYEGQRILIPWKVIGLHVPLAALSLVAAGVLWTRAGENTAWLMDRAQRTVVGRVGLGCATAAVVTTATVLIVILSIRSTEGEEDPTHPEIEYVSFASATAETDHFHFTYPVNLRGRAMPLVARSEELYGGLGELLEMPDRPPATIDLTEASSQHLGIASWTRVRVGLVLHPDPVELEHTVTHELAHVLQHHLSDRRMNDARRATALFIEGSAEYLAYEVVPRPESRLSARRVAAAMWQRHDLSTDELLDHDRMKERWDPRLAYYVGEVYTQAVVDACGEHAVGRVFRAMARPDAPQDSGARRVLAGHATGHLVLLRDRPRELRAHPRGDRRSRACVHRRGAPAFGRRRRPEPRRSPESSSPSTSRCRPAGGSSSPSGAMQVWPIPRSAAPSPRRARTTRCTSMRTFPYRSAPRAFSSRWASKRARTSGRCTSRGATRESAGDHGGSGGMVPAASSRRPFAIISTDQETRSDSVRMPSRCSPSVTSTQPNFSVSMSRAASSAGVAGPQVARSWSVMKSPMRTLTTLSSLELAAASVRSFACARIRSRWVTRPTSFPPSTTGTWRTCSSRMICSAETKS